VFHCRDAYDELLTWLEGSAKLPKRMVFHCFSGSADHAARARALDCYVGFDGPITYRNNDAGRAILRSTPPDRILVETDAPYLSPEPFRGKRNEPAMAALVAAKAAETLGLSAPDFASLTTANAERFFGLSKSGE
jgi:TatD DNase family protein